MNSPFSKSFGVRLDANRGTTHRLRRILVGGESLETRRLLAFDPTPMEQAFMESTNRMRMDPQGELEVLFASTDPLVARDADVQRAMDFFKVDDQLLLDQWSELVAVPPVAWNEALIDGAAAHNQLMKQHDEQSHRLPGEKILRRRLEDAGYPGPTVAENIYAFAEGHVHGHAGFVIDWGEGPGGIQSPAGHRDNYMNGTLTEVGISVITETDVFTEVGPYLVTQDFGDHAGYQPQIVGVAYDDSNGNGIYDPGEGRGELNITAIERGGATYATQTLTAGGYQLEVPEGTYEVIINGPGITDSYVVGNVRMTGDNAKADFELGSAQRAPEAVADNIRLPDDGPHSFIVTSNDISTAGSIVSNSVTIVTQPSYGTLSVNASGQITYAADGSRDSDSFSYTVRDTNGGTSNAADVTVTIGGDPTAPVASDVNIAVTGGGSHSIYLGGSVADVDGDVDWSTLQIVSTAAHGTLLRDPQNQSFIYSVDGGFTGSDSFSYAVSDLTGLPSGSATVTVTVQRDNNPPVAMPDVFVVVDGEPLNMSLLANDIDADGSLNDATIQILSPPTVGAATVSGTTVFYSPGAGGTSEATTFDSLTYRISDAGGAVSEQATVSVYFVTSDRAWHNPLLDADVNADGVISPLDALTVINHLGIESLTYPSSAPSLSGGPPPFVDVDSSGTLSPLDALFVINELSSTAPAASSSEVFVPVFLQLADSGVELAKDTDDDAPSVVDRVFAQWGASSPLS